MRSSSKQTLVFQVSVKNIMSDACLIKLSRLICKNTFSLWNIAFYWSLLYLVRSDFITKMNSMKAIRIGQFTGQVVWVGFRSTAYLPMGPYYYDRRWHDKSRDSNFPIKLSHEGQEWSIPRMTQHGMQEQHQNLKL